jgi:hypothetical protein
MFSAYDESVRAASDCLAASLALTLLLIGMHQREGALSRCGRAVSMSWKHPKAGPNELEK